MRQKTPSFAELLIGAAKLIPGLVVDGKPNLTAISKHTAKRGHRVPQPTLHRHVYPKDGESRRLQDEVARALEAVFAVPARYWKGEPMSDQDARALHQVNLETILLAQKIESLPQKVRDELLTRIENAATDQEELRRLLASTSNVTPIDRGKR